MQAKDVPDRPILEQLAANPKWHTWHGDGSIMPTVTVAMPPETPVKVVHAKMRGLIKRGLVSGCGCGCRGDFEITERGRAILTRAVSSPNVVGSDPQETA